ncbi:uncharacterized protein LOC144489987 isoform X2 [Mustelus asterias]
MSIFKKKNKFHSTKRIHNMEGRITTVKRMSRNMMSILSIQDQIAILNHSCRIMNFIDFVKQTCKCETEACIDLIDESGNLMNLSAQQNSFQFASNILKERKKYILIKVTKQDDSETIKYESLLKNIDLSHPALAGEGSLEVSCTRGGKMRGFMYETGYNRKVYDLDRVQWESLCMIGNNGIMVWTGYRSVYGLDRV